MAHRAGNASVCPCSLRTTNHGHYCPSKCVTSRSPLNNQMAKATDLNSTPESHVSSINFVVAVKKILGGSHSSYEVRVGVLLPEGAIPVHSKWSCRREVAKMETIAIPETSGHLKSPSLETFSSTQMFSQGIRTCQEA